MPNKVNLPEDANSNAVQVLTPDVNNTVVGTAAAASSRVALPTASDIVQIVTQQDCWVKFGDVTITAVAATAGNMLLLGGERVFRVPTGMTHLAFVRDTADGRFSVTGLY
jgi:hypothetical protein